MVLEECVTDKEVRGGEFGIGIGTVIRQIDVRQMSFFINLLSIKFTMNLAEGNPSSQLTRHDRRNA